MIERALLCVRAQSHPTLCDPMDCSLPGSSVYEIFQARILEWVVISYSRDLPDPGIKSLSFVSLELASRFLTTSATSSTKQRKLGTLIPVF